MSNDLRALEQLVNRAIGRIGELSDEGRRLRERLEAPQERPGAAEDAETIWLREREEIRHALADTLAVLRDPEPEDDHGNEDHPDEEDPARG